MRRRDSAGDLILYAFAGIAIGVVGGILLGEWVGDVNRDRVRRGLTRLRKAEPKAPPIDEPKLLRQVVTQALRAAPDVSMRGIKVHPIDAGVVELTGWTDDEAERERLAEVARGVRGVSSVINRVLVRGVDDAPPGPDSPDRD